MKWPIGIITDIVPGAEGKSQVVKVRTGAKEMYITNVNPRPIESTNSKRDQVGGNVVTKN